MPGITLYLNYNNQQNDKINDKLNKLKGIFKIPSLDYSEENLIHNSILTYSVIPGFIKTQKLKLIKHLIIILDGDFYNDEELIDFLNIGQLSKLEIIYNLFLKKGENFADLLNGEFNIIVINTLDKNVHVTNDRFARKPLFYYRKEEILIISSEKKGILCLMEEKKTIDAIGVLQVFALKHNIDDKSFIQNIYKLKPASVIIFNKNQILRNVYFKWRFNTEYKLFSRKKVVEEIFEKFQNAVELRIIGKERILLWLSGGFDSRSIASIIRPEIRQKITTECYGESFSEELKIADKVSEKLGYKFTKRSVNTNFTTIAKVGLWRSEFSIIPFEHPQLSFHKQIKDSADYIISGLPGFDVLNGGHVNLGKIYGSLFKDYYKKWFSSYSVPFENLKYFLNTDFLTNTYPDLFSNFEKALDNIDVKHKLDKWDIFNITERQPNYSNMSDLVEAELFETLHPFCDIELTTIFLKIPKMKRMFQQLSKEMIYYYFPEVRDINYDAGRKLRKNNSTANTILNEILQKLKKNNSHTLIWDRKEALIRDILNVKNDLNRALSYPELFEYINKKSIITLLNTESLIYEKYLIVEQILSLLYAYEFFIQNSDFKIPKEIIAYYN
ncbi:MAG: asparagine synthase-related protein [Melioribacteraceae bacterium]